MTNGLFWNTVYDEQAPTDTVPSITHAEPWQRLVAFLGEAHPIAAEAGVKLAAPPGRSANVYSPPAPAVRLPAPAQSETDRSQSEPSEQVEICIRSLAEGRVYEAAEPALPGNGGARVRF